MTFKLYSLGPKKQKHTYSKIILFRVLGNDCHTVNKFQSKCILAVDFLWKNYNTFTVSYIQAYEKKNIIIIKINKNK